MNVETALKYDPHTGQFTWLPGTRKAGKLAGSFNKRLGYSQIRHLGKHYYAHRLAWWFSFGNWPDYVDHINGIKTDNRLINLRSVTKQENHKNMKKFSTCSSGVTGVQWRNDFSKWVANITVDSRALYLGAFSSFEEAVACRKSAELQYGFHVNHGRTH